MKRRVTATILATLALLTLTAAAPANTCACGSGSDQHASEHCYYISNAPSPYWECWSPALGTHRH